MSLGLRFRLLLEQSRLIDRKLAKFYSDAEAFLSPEYRMLDTAIGDLAALLDCADQPDE
ncbi:MAG: hypothetical protein QNL59_09975 [Actinomycetota bacterium]|jgi:hypothetical protein